MGASHFLGEMKITLLLIVHGREGLGFQVPKVKAELCHFTSLNRKTTFKLRPTLLCLELYSRHHQQQQPHSFMRVNQHQLGLTPMHLLLPENQPARLGSIPRSDKDTFQRFKLQAQSYPDSFRQTSLKKLFQHTHPPQSRAWVKESFHQLAPNIYNLSHMAALAQETPSD